jgi:hypothetical protein
MTAAGLSHCGCAGGAGLTVASLSSDLQFQQGSGLSGPSRPGAGQGAARPSLTGAPARHGETARTRQAGQRAAPSSPARAGDPSPRRQPAGIAGRARIAAAASGPGRGDCLRLARLQGLGYLWAPAAGAGKSYGPDQGAVTPDEAGGRAGTVQSPGAFAVGVHRRRGRSSPVRGQAYYGTYRLAATSGVLI